jgi:hypothetical protein
MLEQQINITTQEFSTTNTTASPTDNSLGLIQWMPDLYNNETVYFEAVLYCDSCSGANATATLYNDSGTAVSGASVSTSDTSYALVRSGDITGNLTTNDDYTVRLKADTSGTAYLTAARLIIVQDNDPITDTLTHVELGNTTTTTSDSYDIMSGPVIYYYDVDSHTDLSAVYFEATLKGSGAGAVSYASLSSSSTCASTVSGSELTVTGTTWSRVMTSDIKANLADNTEYWICTKTSTGDTASIANGKLIFKQVNALGIDIIETYQNYITFPVSDTDSTYTAQGFLNQFNPDNFVSDTQSMYFEATLNSSLGTGYASLLNVTDTSAITGSEVSHDSASYARKRSQDIRTNLASTTKTYDAQLKNGTTNTTSASSSWLIIRIDDILDASMSFTMEGTLEGLVFNEITTSTATTFPGLTFGSLTANVPKYLAHMLTVETNAPYGYSVTSRIENYLQGLYPANNFDGFPAPWDTPTTWTEPTGLTRNQDSGWIGANTTDTRVTGWSSGVAQKFGVVNNTAHQVMYSATSDSGTTAYVTYAIEANVMQPADSYAGSIIYEVLPTY